MAQNIGKIKVHESKKIEDSQMIFRVALQSMMGQAYKMCTGKCLKDSKEFKPSDKERVCLEECYMASFYANSAKSKIYQEFILEKLG